MRQSLRTVTILGFALACAILGVVGTVTYRNTSRLLADAELVERTNTILTSLTALLSELNEAEATQRGYLITADSQYYLPRFRGAIVGTRAQLGQLRGLVAGNQQQSQQVERLQQLIDLRISQLEGRVRLRDLAGRDAVERDLQSRPANRAIQNAARLFEGHERRTLEQRSESARMSGQETQLTVVLGTVIAALLVALALIAINREARERMAAHGEVAEKEQQLMQFMNALPMGMLVLDRAAKVKYVNQAARDLFGAHAVPGVDYRSIFSVFWPGTEDPFPEERLPMMRALQGEATTMSDLEVRVRDRLLEVGVSAAPVRDADNRVVYSIATFTDISARRSVERMKDEFLSMVSHELRTPLTSIRGALGLLSSGKLGELSGKGLRMVEIAVNDTDRLVRLINDILDIERMESGRISLERSQVAADQLVQRAVEAIMPLAERAGVKLTTATQPVTVWADPDRILQTLTNLLGNAIKFTPAGAGVQVTVEVNGSEAVFSVHDQGRGIPGDKLQSIFERFQQVDASDARQKGGAGLGLAISRSIVLQHSGHIWAESDGKTGSTFRFTLPVLHADAVTIDLPARAPVVLLGEASATAREVLQSILQENGYSVLIADTGLQVLELAKSMGPSVILLDLQKPDLETSRWLHEDEATRNIPVVDLSELSSAESADRPSSGEPGKPLDPGSASGWLSRPVDPGALIESVDRALSSNGKMQRVLIIEDDVPLANVLRELFEARNLHPMVAFNTEDAVRALEKVTPNVIVLDLGDRTGFELVDMLRGKEHTRSIPLVVYTSSELDAGARGRLRLGPGEFLQKSRVHPEEVAHRVALLLHRVTGES